MTFKDQMKQLIDTVNEIEMLMLELVELHKNGIKKQRAKRIESQKDDATNQTVSKLIGTYISLWQKRYETKGRPDVGPKARGILQRLVSHMSEEYLSQLIATYCKMDNEWFKTKRHDLATLEQNINVVALALSGGKEEVTKQYPLGLSPRELEINRNALEEMSSVPPPDMNALDRVRNLVKGIVGK